jgi:uncharacterized protein YaeQ|uniref:YaeQ family protein n=1 Tax=Polynucleobacter sp. TaxID=2029855 RepID=UPI004048129E
MALRATIHKADLHVSDSDRHYYGSHSLTIAKHPSETDERMMIRIIAFALQAHEDLSFTKGLSDTDEPDLWIKDLTDAILLWVEIGQPDERRILKACGRSDQVIVYCYGGQTSKIWWDGIANKLTRARNLNVIAIPAEQAQALNTLIERSMVLHVNVQDGEAYVSSDQGQATITPEVWRSTP